MLSSRALRAAALRAIRLIEERGFRRGKHGPGLCVGDAIAEADPKKKYRWTLWARAESVMGLDFINLVVLTIPRRGNR